MKKIAIAALMAVSAMSASALELGVTATRDHSGSNSSTGGLTLGTKVGGLGLTAGFERTTQGAREQDRISLVADRALMAVGPVSLAVRAGVAHLDNTRGADGYAMTVGVGANYALTKTVAMTVALDRQYGQDRVSAYDGNRVTVGIKTSF